jgi:hypothetical protein
MQDIYTNKIPQIKNSYLQVSPTIPVKMKPKNVCEDFVFGLIGWNTQPKYIPHSVHIQGLDR